MTPDEKITVLREKMQERKMDAYLIPTDDYHMSEYVGEHFKEREYMSGFSGSAGTLLVTQTRALLWTDGRYFLQAQEQLENTSIELMKMGQPGVQTVVEFLAEMLPVHGIIGFDGRTVTAAYVERLLQKAAGKQVKVAAGEDLVDEIWKDRPLVSKEPVWELSIEYAGVSREDKLADIHRQMEQDGTDALLLTTLDEIAWLLNLRGNDVRNTPVFLAYMLITPNRNVLCLHREILPEKIRDELRNAGVETADYQEIEELLQELPEGTVLQADRQSVNYHLWECVPGGIRIKDKESPVVKSKAIKNQTEIRHIRQAHIKDGIAVTKLIYWLKTHVGKEKITEISAAAKLEELRAQAEDYLGPSFDPIIAYGAHGAIVHYEATPETDVELLPEGLLLMDTGGHYLEGTTDITRTIALGEISEEERQAYTAVLRGHLHLGAAHFLYGCCGQNLDILAREPLWEQGLDFRHGTGHGVGYLLNVHEGPQSFRFRITENGPAVVLEEGMILSNEPGYYCAGKYGIRHENLVLCTEAQKTEYGRFMKLDTLTMVPFDIDAIDPRQMTEQELKWLNEYHQRVYQTLSPYFEGEELVWLRNITNILTCI
jgi:Xaa-Pro aminopeptidase